MSDELPAGAREALAESASKMKDAPPSEVAAVMAGSQPPPSEPDDAPDEQGRPEPAETPEADTSRPEPEDDSIPDADYDPEEHAVYPDEDEGGGEQPPTDAPDTPSVAPDGSKWTAEEREAFEAYKASRAEQDRQPTEEAPQETLQDTLRRLMSEQPEVARKVEALEPARAKRDELARGVTEAETAVQTATKELDSLTERLAYARDLATEDPDDLAATERVSRLEAAVVSKRTERLDAKQRLAETRLDYGEAAQAYQAGIVELRGIGERAQQSAREQAEDEGIRSQAETQALAEWDAALPKVLSKYGFESKEDRDDIENELALRVEAMTADPNATPPENLETWMDGVVGAYARRIERHTGRSLQDRAAARRRVVDQGAPTGKAALADKREPAKLSSRAEMARAGKLLVRELQNQPRPRP